MVVGDFVHLHLHTQYSLLDGAVRLVELFPRVRELGQTAVALTDHGVMYGAIDFYERAREAEVRPILGCEMYVAPGDMRDRTQRGAGHIVLLATNLEGYRNLVYLVSRAFLDGFHYSPRVDRKLLGERGRGIIALSGCPAGDVARVVREQGERAGERTALEYRDLFDGGNYYLEVQDTGYPEQRDLNAALRSISTRTGIPLVATNDVHYLHRDDAAAHDILMRIQEGKTIHDEVSLSHSKLALYLRSGEEMREALPDYVDAVERTLEIAARCNVELPLGTAMLPRYSVPKGETLETYLRRLAYEGLAWRIEQARGAGRKIDETTYRERLDYELGIICDKGYTGYFLIVQDFIRYARDEGIPVGPGRGSGAGSLVAYSLRITDIDPMRFGLLFERFLNPDRPSMPDFDIDFCKDRREEVIAYVTRKYGADRVGQIATFHQLRSRAAVKDVGRVLTIPYAERDRLSKLIPPAGPSERGSIEQALRAEPRLRAEYDSRPDVRRLLDFASRLEGLHRHAGQHAAGIVIGDRPLWELVPVFRSKEGALVSQYDMNSVARVGLVKFDFLGLRNLTAIDKAVKLVRARRGFDAFDIGAIPLDDRRVFDLLSSGRTLGVFQLESRGFRELLRRLRPDCIEDIVAAVALYRPGPLGVGADEMYIRRKHGQEPAQCIHSSVRDVCNETYGVILYQEQVMNIAVAMAGYTLGAADALRKAMGKKDAAVMERQREPFVEGAMRNGIDAGVAARVFEEIAQFAEYAFNKSHSAAYAVLAYQTAYLKVHHPVEFLAALLTCDRDDTDRVVRYISEARSMSIEVLGPDINESQADFTVREAGDRRQDGPGPSRCIRFGLGAVRGVGGAALEAIIEARAEGPFADLFDFCARVDARRVNRAVLESLVKGGAFDSLSVRHGVSRAAVFGNLDRAMEYGRARQRDRQIGQQGLFDAFGPAVAAGASHEGDAGVSWAPVDEWDETATLRYERHAIGAYLSGHPLHRFADDIRRYANAVAGEVEERPVGAVVSVGGLVEGMTERLNKKTGRRTAVFLLEDLTGAVETFVPPHVLEKYEAVLRSGRPILCTGRVETSSFREAATEGEDETLRFVLAEARTFADVRQERTRAVRIRLDGSGVDERALARLRATLDANRGPCPAFLHIAVPNRGETIVALPDRYRVDPSDDFVVAVAREFGSGRLEFS